jgi:hypothetical protein
LLAIAGNEDAKLPAMAAFSRKLWPNVKSSDLTRMALS